MERKIIHVDMDEFFAAVEKLDHPEYRGQPLLIGGSPSARGVVATASYEARPFGCRSAMPMAQAVRLCPRAIVLPVRGERYAEASEQVFTILERFTPLLEPLSIDEAFLDVTGCQRLLGPAEEIGRKIKADVRGETGLTASLGVAPNKFLAKLASDLEKPDGLVILDEHNAQQVLDGLAVTKLWGVGPASASGLERLNVRTVGQLRRMPRDVLAQAFGEATADHYLALAHGRDDRPVEGEGQARSLGTEETFPQDVAEIDELRGVLLRQVEHIARRLRRRDLQARTVTLKLRYGDFTTLTRAATLPAPTNATADLWRAATGVFDAWASASARPLRLLGVTASNLVPRPGRQLELFASDDSLRQRRLDGALDRIVERFGDDAIRRGGE